MTTKKISIEEVKRALTGTLNWKAADPDGI